MGEKVYIYGLVDPRDEHVKYVGKTVSPGNRLLSHKNTREGNGPKRRWIDELLSLGLKPQMKILCECTSATWRDEEARLTDEMRKIHPLYSSVRRVGLGALTLEEKGRGLEKHVATTVRLPKRIVVQIEEHCKQYGVSRTELV